MGICGHQKDSLNISDQNGKVKKSQNSNKEKIDQKVQKVQKEQKEHKEKKKKGKKGQKEQKDIIIKKGKKTKNAEEVKTDQKEKKNQKDQEEKIEKDKNAGKEGKEEEIEKKEEEKEEKKEEGKEEEIKKKEEEKEEEKKNDNISRNYKQISDKENNETEFKEIIDMKTKNKNEKLKSFEKILEKENIINDEQDSKENNFKEKNLEEENIKESKKEKIDYDTIYNAENEYKNLKLINLKNNAIKQINFLKEIAAPLDYYFVCLRCKCRSPHIEKINSNSNLMDIKVSYYCACLPESTQNESLKKLINSTKPLNLCPIHSNKTLKFYCSKCKKSFCEKCQKDSEEHIKFLVNYDIIMSEDNAEQIKNFLYKTQNESTLLKIIDDFLNNIKKIDTPKYHLKETININDKITTILLLQSGLIATGSYGKTICIWNIKELSCDKKIKVLEKVLSLLEFKQNMLLSSQESKICLYNINLNNDECIYTFKGHELWVNCLIKYDDKIFASASNDHKIIIWNYEQRKKINEFEVYKNSIFSLIKLNDGNLCFGGADSEIRIFDWKQGRIINTLKGHNGWVMCLCQMDNETLLSGSDDKTIKVWKNNNCIFTIEGHSHMVKVLLKLNDNYFASGSFDNTIKIWDIKTYSSQQTLTGHSSKIFCLIKLDNNYLISSSDDNIIKIWGN